MSVEECLPPELRGPATAIARIATGMSGAAVYLVDAVGRAFVLKISAADEPVEAWRRKLAIQRAAAAAKLAAQVVHADEERRAIVSVFVQDRGVIPRIVDPRTRDEALAQLGRVLAAVHALPVSAGAASPDPLGLLVQFRGGLDGHPVPPFVDEAIAALLAEPPPAADRAPVLSHNDVNPTNLVHDGERMLLLDWDVAGPNDPLFDLAAVAVFFRLDDAACAALIAAHDGAPAAEVPARFHYLRRLIAILCGTGFLRLARVMGHAGATGETLESAPTMAAFYQQLRAGAIDLAAADGRWTYGLALVKSGVTRADPAPPGGSSPTAAGS